MKFEAPTTVAIVSSILAALVGLTALVVLFDREESSEPAEIRFANPPHCVQSFRSALLEGHPEEAEKSFQAMKELSSAALLPATDLLRDPDIQVRRHGAELLQELIEHVSQDNTAEIPSSCLRKLVPFLVECIKDDDARVRSEVVSALGWLGPAAQAALPGITQAITDESEMVRGKAERALKRIRGLVVE